MFNGGGSYGGGGYLQFGDGGGQLAVVVVMGI